MLGYYGGIVVYGNKVVVMYGNGVGGGVFVVDCVDVVVV